MSFSIKLEEEKAAQIASWSLSSRLINEVLEHLYEKLAEYHQNHLERISKPADRLVYNFTIRAEGDPPPQDYLFEFSVRYHADKEMLIIWDCDTFSVEARPG